MRGLPSPYDHFVSAALASMTRRGGATALAVISLMAPLYLLGAFATTGVQTWSHARKLRAAARLVVFLKDDATNADRAALETCLRGSEARSFRYVDRDEAAARMKDVIDTSALAESPFPASYEVVMARGSEEERAFVEALRRLPGVEDVSSELDLLEKLSSLERLALVLLLLLAAVLLGSLLVMIGNTIKLVFLARADEVALLKVMGATDDFVSGPFLVEGALLGASSGVIAGLLFGLTKLLLLALTPATAGMLGGAVRELSLLPSMLLLPGFGLVLGFGGTRLALRQLLRSS